MPAARLGILWEGSLFAHHSFANINREVTSLLARRPDVDLGLVAYGPADAGTPADPRFRRVAALVGHEPSTVHCHVRHRWPPDFERPDRGAFVLVQPWEFSSLPRAWVAAVAQAVDEWWVPSAFVRDAGVRSGVAEEQLVVIPFGVNPEAFNPGVAPVPPPTRRAFRFLFVGGGIERKGFDLLLRAYVGEFDSDDDVCLVVKDFFYGGHAREVVESLAQRPRAPEIRYSYGTSVHDSLGGLYTACDCYVQPYRGEGFGLTIVEAMACGLPVIVTGAGPAAEYCSEEAGYFVPATQVPVPQEVWPPSLATERTVSWYEPDLGALRHLMRHAYEHPAEGRRKGAAGSAQVLANHTWARTVERMVARLERFGQGG